MEEEWRVIPGWPYSASSLGRIRNDRNGRLMRCTVKKGGYRSTTLSSEGVERYEAVHVLVMEAFVAPRPKDHECNHKDGNKLDNRPSNLEWVTREQNIAHACEMGLLPHGSSHKNSKLDEGAVVQIRRRVRGGETIAAVADDFNVARSTVARVARGTAWAHVKEAPAEDWQGNRGESNGQSKLTARNVKAIRRRLEEGDETPQKIGEDFGVSSHTVRLIRQGKTWRHV